MNSNHIAEIVKNTGIAQVKNFLSKEEIEKVKIAIDPFLRKKTKIALTMENVLGNFVVHR